MFRKKDAEVYYINERSRSASEELASLFSYCIQKDGRMFRELVFLCIGSDRITGDSLGPLIGYQLSPYCSRIFHVYGTLDDPEALLVAIDASLGSRRHQGYITIGNGAIRPGAGAGKTLPEVGDIFITGIVNVSGSFEQLLLQTTRLATIFHMAESISQGILLACRELEAAGTSELLL